MTKPFQLIAGHSALDLVNTLDWRFRDSGAEELLSTYDDLLRFTDESAVLTPRQLRQLRRMTDDRTRARILRSSLDLRETVAAIFYALVDDRTPPRDAIKRLNQHLHAARANRMLFWTRSGFQSTWPAEPNVSLPLWVLAQSASDLLTADTAQSIRACADPGCRWLFLDTTKNHSRLWCDMKICGNRMKARRFRVQHKHEPAASTIL